MGDIWKVKKPRIVGLYAGLDTGAEKFGRG